VIARSRNTNSWECQIEGARPSFEKIRTPGPIFLSTNAGATWWETGAPKLHSSSIACSSGAGKLVAAADEGVYLSRDSGKTWQLSGLATKQVWRRVTASADATKLAVATGSGVCLSADSGVAWTLSPAPANLANVDEVVSSADETRLYLAFNGGNSHRFGGPIDALQTGPHHP